MNEGAVCSPQIYGKILLVDQEKCRACRTCELVCSFFKSGECNPAKSRIHSERWEDKTFLGKSITRVCQQCTPPACKVVCPSGAITLDQNTGAMLVDHIACKGCGLCINACPFGAVRRDPEKGIPLICDLCGGKPKCVEWCPANAILYVPVTWSSLTKKREWATALLSTISESRQA